MILLKEILFGFISTQKIQVSTSKTPGQLIILQHSPSSMYDPMKMYLFTLLGRLVMGKVPIMELAAH